MACRRLIPADCLSGHHGAAEPGTLNLQLLTAYRQASHRLRPAPEVAPPANGRRRPDSAHRPYGLLPATPRISDSVVPTARSESRWGAVAEATDKMSRFLI